MKPSSRLGTALLLLLAGLLASCTSLRSQGSVDPELQGRMDRFVLAEMRRGNIPGAAVVVLTRGTTTLTGAYGSANLELNVPVSAGSVFELASLTKQFTAAGILLLADQGKLSLDDPVAKFIEQAPSAWAGITLRHLLSHSAGLEHRFEGSVDGILLLDYTTQDMLRSAMAMPTFAAPGKRFRYSDQGYFLLGLVIEKVSAKSFANFMVDMFFAPLGMNDTYIQDQARPIMNRVAGYTVRGGNLENIRRSWQFGLSSHFGVLSTAADMAKWERSLWSATVLPDAVLRQLGSPVYIFRQDDSRKSLLAYGYGWWVIEEGGHRIIEHSGITGTHYFRDATNGITVIVLTNRDQASGQGTADIARGIAGLLDASTPAAPK